MSSVVVGGIEAVEVDINSGCGSIGMITVYRYIGRVRPDLSLITDVIWAYLCPTYVHLRRRTAASSLLLLT